MIFIFTNKKVQIIAACLLLFSFFYFIIYKAIDNPNFDFISEYKSEIFRGFYTTILISILALVISIILGSLLYAMSNSKQYFNKVISSTITQIMLGTPLLVFIIIMIYYLGFAIFGIRNEFILGVFSLGIYMAPYMSNVFKSQIESIEKSQHTVMELYNFNLFQKYFLIIIPQIRIRIIPPLMNNLSMIIKGSALLSVVAISEIYYVIQQAQNNTFRFQEGYLVMWGLYLCITIPISLLSLYLEKRFKYES